MIINRETAMRLWNQQIGSKDTEAYDYAGRLMKKAAYGDRNSEYGWNLDHILPVSKNGKTNDSNLICCHILTNDEKGDRFPAFNAHERAFEIRRVQNHYEIFAKKEEGQSTLNDDSVDFFDHAAGIRLFQKHLKEADSFGVTTGVVYLEAWPLCPAEQAALTEFVKGLRGKGGEVDARSCSSSGNRLQLEILYPAVEDEEHIAAILDSCVLLNTYLASYFSRKEAPEYYRLHFSLEKRTTLDRYSHWKEGLCRPIFQQPANYPEEYEPVRYIDAKENGLYVNFDPSKHFARELSQNIQEVGYWWSVKLQYGELAKDLQKEVEGE